MSTISHSPGGGSAPDDPRVPLAIEQTLPARIRTVPAMIGFGLAVVGSGLFLRALPAAITMLPSPSLG